MKRLYRKVMCGIDVRGLQIFLCFLYQYKKNPLDILLDAWLNANAVKNFPIKMFQKNIQTVYTRPRNMNKNT